MATKPTVKPLFANNDTTLPTAGTANKIQPSTSIRNTGLDKNSPINAQELNWQFDNLREWVEWAEASIDPLEETVDGLFTYGPPKVVVTVVPTNSSTAYGSTFTMQVITGGGSTFATVGVNVVKTTADWAVGSGQGGKLSSLSSLDDTFVLCWALSMSNGYLDAILTPTTTIKSSVLTTTGAVDAVVVCVLRGITTTELCACDFRDGIMTSLYGYGSYLTNNSITSGSAVVNSNVFPSVINTDSTGFPATTREFCFEWNLTLDIGASATAGAGQHVDIQVLRRIGTGGDSVLSSQGQRIKAFWPAADTVFIHEMVVKSSYDRYVDLSFTRVGSASSISLTSYITGYTITNWNTSVIPLLR